MLPFSLLVCTGTSAFAGTSTSVDAHYDIVVTGRRREVALDDTLLSRELAESRGLAFSDMLARAAGVRVLRTGNVAKPVIDGFTGSRVLIANDGIRLHSQSWGLEHAPEIDAFSVDRIEIIRGAAGVRYGADALGGAVLVQPPPLRADEGISGDINLVAISNGYFGAGALSLTGTFPSLPELAWRAHASYRRGGSSFTPLYELDNTALAEASVGGTVAYRGDRTLVSTSVSWFKSRLGIFSGIYADGPADFLDSLTRDIPRSAELFEFSYAIDRAYQEAAHLFLRSELEHRFSNGFAINALYGFQLNDRREFDRVRRSTSGAQLLLSLASHSAALTLEHSVGDDVHGTFGLSGLHQNNDHEGRRLIPDYELWNGSVFLVENYDSDNFKLEVGARWEATSAHTEEPARIAPNRNPAIRHELRFDAFVGILGVELWPISHLTVEARMATATRIPSMNELFIDGPSQGQGTFETGDRDLENEKTMNVSIGAAYRRGWFHAAASVYAHFIRDYVYFAPLIRPDGRPDVKLTVAGAFPAFEYRNVDAVQSSTDLEVSIVPWPELELTTHVSFIRAMNVSDDAYLLFIPPDRLENRLTFLPPGFGALKDIRAWIESSLCFRQTRVDLRADFTAPPEEYHLVNFGAGTTLQLGSQAYQLSLEIRNLFNTRYRDYLSRLRYYADDPGISAILRIRAPLDVSWEADE